MVNYTKIRHTHIYIYIYILQIHNVQTEEEMKKMIWLISFWYKFFFQILNYI